MKNMNKRFCEITKIVIFLLVVVLILNVLSPIFVPKNNNDASGIKYENARGFYGEAKDSIDIISVGNSDLYSALNPLQLWKEHGFTAYSCAEPYQNIFSAYQILKESLKYQKPKLVILEVDELFSGTEAEDADEMINNTLKSVFPIFEYHKRWKDLSLDEIKNTEKNYDTKMVSKGYIYHDVIESYSGDESYMNKNRRSKITTSAKHYLDKFIRLANDNGAEVLFVWFPSVTTATSKRHDTIQKIADEYNIPFIDFNKNVYNTGFNFLTDTRDGGNHLNYSGATKMTKFIGQYLQDHYQLIDHRDDSAYDNWNQDYERFIKENKIKS